MADLSPRISIPHSLKYAHETSKRIANKILSDLEMYAAVYDGHVAQGKPITGKEKRKAVAAKKAIPKFKRLLADD